MRIGTTFLEKYKCEFKVWAPFAEKLHLDIVAPEPKRMPMIQEENGYWKLILEHISSNTEYYFQLNDDLRRPDPASHYQPRGVHEASQVVNHKLFEWSDEHWKGLPLEEMIIYEIHTGTFTPSGNYEGIISRLPELKDLGINALQIMPIAQFPGERNWGYDGVYPYAVQNSYGGPQEFKKLVNACHDAGLAVLLDVVYNHLGPEGNYFRDFAPYFTTKYKTLWGDALNFDDAHSDNVRNYFIQNAIHWFENYHIDGLRLDAVHAIFDESAKPFLKELAEKVDEFSIQQGRKYYLIAESNLNDSRLIYPRELNGFGLDAVWSDDFHHSVHTLLTGENAGYYLDFGSIDDLTKAIGEGFVYDWKYSAFRERHHGNSSKEIPAKHFVVCIQNHDQVGNRMLGERLSQLISFEAQKLAAGILLLSPNVPLIFMGEEYGEKSPFQYFVSHGDQNLIEAVRQGRKEEFRSFHWEGDPPDPQSMETFQHAKLKWENRSRAEHKTLLEFYKRLIYLRKNIPALFHLDKNSLEIVGNEEDKTIAMLRWCRSEKLLCLLNFNRQDKEIKISSSSSMWSKILDSAEDVWKGQGSALPDKLDGESKVRLNGHSFVIYLEEVTG